MSNSTTVKKFPIERDEKKQAFIEQNITKWMQTGEILKNLRCNRHFTQAQIAKEVGVSRTTISRLERGLPVKNAEIIVNAYRLLIMYEIAWSGFNEVIKVVRVATENAKRGIA